MPYQESTVRRKSDLTYTSRNRIAPTLFGYFHYRGGQRMKYSTGYKVWVKFWDTTTQRLKLHRYHPEHSDINLFLNKLELTINDVYRDFNNGDISPENFRKELDCRLGYIVLMKITGHTTECQFMQYIAIDGQENALHFANLHKLQNAIKNPA